MLAAQRRLAEADGDVAFLRLKAGIHYGPCIAVTLNDRLDYFGSTVNVAARLQDLSVGGDIIVSDSVCDDPEVAEYLHEHGAGLVVDHLQQSLRGFDGKTFSIARVAAADLWVW
ncbi:MAG: adenylate/guanylate cyclase domain-containing protein [Candidatus Latescibacterota bacterium]|jgi:class 3 adenylate cyclase